MTTCSEVLEKNSMYHVDMPLTKSILHDDSYNYVLCHYILHLSTCVYMSHKNNFIETDVVLFNTGHSAVENLVKCIKELLHNQYALLCLLSRLERWRKNEYHKENGLLLQLLRRF